MTDTVINNVQLKFQLEAERKQREYAERRQLHTDLFRREFALWQRDVAEVRGRLLGLVRSRTGPHNALPDTPSPAA